MQLRDNSILSEFKATNMCLKANGLPNKTSYKRQKPTGDILFRLKAAETQNFGETRLISLLNQEKG